MRKVAAVLAMILCTEGLFGYEKLSVLYPSLSQLDVATQKSLTVWQSEEPDWTGGPNRVLWKLYYGVIQSNGSRALAINSTRITESIILTSGYKVRQAEIRYTLPALVTVTGHEIATLAYDSQNRRYVFDMYKNGQKTDHKEVGDDPNTVFVDCMPFLLETLLAQGKTNSFNCELLMRMGLKVNVDVVLKTATNVRDLHPQFNYPDFFTTYLSKGNREYLVYELGVSGVLAAFYPHKFCFVYTRTPKPEYIAYYGGEPRKEASFQVKGI